jgi:hypothetical protein
VFDRYVTAPPSPQNALDIFQGEWTSRLPDNFAGLRAGHMPLFEDDRVVWALGQFGDLRGKSVLELGPLEGGHSYMLERAGCSVLAIEGNTAAFLKCLVIKEVVGLTRTRYVCGDFVEYLRQSPPRVDLVIASGVLYHMAEPLDLLANVSAVTDRLFIWTHYYDPAASKPDPSRFKSEETREQKGFRCPVFYIEYEIAATQWNGFCGGPRRFSRWMRREDILGALAHFGFARIETWAEQPDHPHGPAFALIATR